MNEFRSPDTSFSLGERVALKLEPSKKILYLLGAVRTLQEDLCGKKGKKLVVVYKK